MGLDWSGFQQAAQMVGTGQARYHPPTARYGGGSNSTIGGNSYNTGNNFAGGNVYATGLPGWIATANQPPKAFSYIGQLLSLAPLVGPAVNGILNTIWPGSRATSPDAVLGINSGYNFGAQFSPFNPITMALGPVGLMQAMANMSGINPASTAAWGQSGAVPEDMASLYSTPPK